MALQLLVELSGIKDKVAEVALNLHSDSVYEREDAIMDLMQVIKELHRLEEAFMDGK